MFWTWANLIATIIVASLNLYVGLRAKRSDHPTVSRGWPTRFIVAFFAFFYAAAFAVLLFGNVDVGVWSETLRPWTLLTWGTVWTLDSIHWLVVIKGHEEGKT